MSTRRTGGRPNANRNPQRGRQHPGIRREAPRREGADEAGGAQVEGRQAVRELLRAGIRPVREVLVEQGRDANPVLEEIMDLAEDNGVPMRFVGREQLLSVARTESPQGVVARAVPLQPMSLRALTESAPGVPPFLVVFDGISDPQNLGAVMRSALCAGATGVVLPAHRNAHVTPAVTKAAAGAIEHLPIAIVPGVGSALVDLKRAGVWSVGLDAGGDVGVDDVAVFDQPVALVLGAEGRGLSDLSRSRCDLIASIGISGPLDSLNVSAAAAVALFAVARRRELHGH